MIILYNILQAFLITILGLPLLIFGLLIPKYRCKVLRQLGINVNFPQPKKKKTKRIWVHALSVGEVTSVAPLLAGIKRKFENVEICFSSTTSSGMKTAKSHLQADVDYFFVAPFDILPIVFLFNKRIQPDVYIQVETDFWPNQLFVMQKTNTPSILVNGRISDKSFSSYNRFSVFFRPLFSSFHSLSMQTQNDRKKMISLGVEQKKVQVLGNLKYGKKLEVDTEDNPLQSYFDPNKICIVAGSTHRGEEIILLRVFKRMLENNHACQLIIAPRDISRSAEISKMSQELGITYSLYTHPTSNQASMLILDTLGQLFSAYQQAHIAFVGGSLVSCGGHNPIEPALCSIPVIFGSHMEDFSEVSADLINCGGAFVANSEEDVFTLFETFSKSATKREMAGTFAKTFVQHQEGIIDKHLSLINKLL